MNTSACVGSEMCKKSKLHVRMPRLDGNGMTFDTIAPYSVGGVTPCITIYESTESEVNTKRDELALKLTPPWCIFYIYGTSPMVMKMMTKLSDGSSIDSTMSTTGLGFVS